MDQVTPEQQLSANTHFGVEVKAARDSRKQTQRHLASGTGYSVAYVSKVENGVLMPSARFAERCDLVFGTGGLFTRLRQRISETEAPSWAVTYLKLEAKAERVLDWSVHCLNGLLQTEDYARAILRAGNPHQDAATIDAMVTNRMRRYPDAFESAPKARLWAVIYEACIRSRVGGDGVMAGQLDHLITLAQKPEIDLQIMPFAGGAAASHASAFSLMTFTDDTPTALWTDGPVGGRLYQHGATARTVAEMHERLRAHAVSPEESLDLMRKISEEHR
ncbi:helix-turn-helix domain-containing protein [Streptomyces marincola]|uniref:helix-turn-helix domain-containing protein n=1 Tax=Streptomyces marincola TaxID=2878388 RepID=UPI001CF5CADB|nr:helix-turn-helix transcriptional regulator [Streptomyces marincola]UCM88504.1 helix-turn-helix transcriptional regulator [Streptomyces marincola]